MCTPDEGARDTSVCDGDSGFLSEKDLSFAELSFGDKSNFTVITCWCYLLKVFFTHLVFVTVSGSYCFSHSLELEWWN